MTIPPLVNVGSKRGAPMGRTSIFNTMPNHPVELTVIKVKLVDGCYDEGGAYWGMNSVEAGKLYRLHSEYGDDFFLRAKDRKQVCQKALAVYPLATFSEETK